jgi:hypothetical protein
LLPPDKELARVAKLRELSTDRYHALETGHDTARATKEAAAEAEEAAEAAVEEAREGAEA